MSDVFEHPDTANAEYLRGLNRGLNGLLDAKIDQVADLTAQNARLAAFAREIIEPAFDGQDVDGGTIQRLALHYGLLTEGKYDPEKHGPSFAEPGDQWFTYAGPLAPPNAS
jgi:hypothetical protein